MQKWSEKKQQQTNPKSHSLSTGWRYCIMVFNNMEFLLRFSFVLCHGWIECFYIKMLINGKQTL